jgi:uncharacterized protein YgbK (DUF1537 family)
MIGVVADDITGANDIGIMFAKSNILTHVYAYDDFSAERLKNSNEIPGVIILDTNSRLDSREMSFSKVAQATKSLRDAGASMFINKTCSVFRGNIGSEFDAMLETLNENFAVVVLGFPKNGRKTLEGVHYVHGKRLQESEFRNDPVHPMTQSRLVDILQAQTERKVDSLYYQTIEKGPDQLRECIQEKKQSCSYLILDVADQEALSIIAEAVKNETVLCGSSALAEELAAQLDIERQSNEQLNVEKQDHIGMLCTAGSLMPQTAAQIDYLKQQKVPIFELNTLLLLDAAERESEIKTLTDTIIKNLMSGVHTVLHTSNEKKTVEKTKQRGLLKGLSSEEISRIVSTTIAEITAQVMERTGQYRLIVAGGETSAAVCNRLGIKGLRIWKEIESGLPSCVSLDTEPKLLVLKSGSFGKPDFFARALEHLISQ